MNGSTDFPVCAICGTDNWRPVFTGEIRDGVFGATRYAEVRRCASCSVDRLAESACLQADAYRSSDYRDRLEQGHSITRHYAEHDELARFTLDTLWPRSLRGKIVADVGCGGGALLDHLRGVAGRTIAIDPALPFAESLKARGYDWFPSAEDAAVQFGGQVDFVLSTQVIEHVDDPRGFLEAMAALLSEDGIAVVSTPNRSDILMELLPDTFPSFFYRVQHRWAFDAESLEHCARLAGFDAISIQHVHRYGLANAIQWLRDRRPRGRTPLPPLDSTIDRHWQAWLESTGRADNLYMLLHKPGRIGV